MDGKDGLAKFKSKGIRPALFRNGLVLFLLLITLSWSVPATLAQTWEPTDNLGTARRHATVTRLLDGKVLVAGGNNLGPAQSFNTAEIYDPETGQFTPTGSMATPRTLHTATLLQDGRVLIAGGWDIVGTPHNLASAEIYDPASGTFSPTGSMTVSRSQHAATMLQNGTVLITAGWGVSPAPNNQFTAEIFDPSGTGTFIATGSLSVGRNTHTATLLQDGRVLVVGGVGPIGTLKQAEIFEPSSGSFSGAGGIPSSPRAAHTATLLPTGKVLIAGGNSGSGPLVAAELYDPSGGGSFSTTVGPLVTARQWHAATLLSGGNVLLAGGNNDTSNGWWISTNYLNSAELYDTTSNSFYTIAPMADVRSMVQAAMLQNGEVLVPGGGPASAELYTGLVAWYPFNGDAVDQSSNGNDAAVTGATLTQDIFGNLNSAYEFDGTDDSIEAADSPSLNTGGAITLAAWVKPDLNSGVTLPIVLKYQSPPSNPLGDNTQAAYWLYGWTVGGITGPRFRVDPIPPGNVGDVVSPELLSTTSWSFVVGTYDGSAARIYVNGELKGTDPGSGRIQLTTIPLTIGSSKYETFSPSYFDGKIDEVRIYNRAITVSEIRELMSTAAAPAPCAEKGGDEDGDKICDDIPGVSSCSGGNTLNCDDNCPDVPNPLQKDSNNDGIGDQCEEDFAMPGEDETNEPAGSVVVAPSPDGAVNLSITVTLNSLGYDTDYVEPEEFNVITRLYPCNSNLEIIADKVRCGTPCRLPDDLKTVTVAEGFEDYYVTFPLSKWFTNLQPDQCYRAEVEYVNFCDDLRKDPITNICPDDNGVDDGCYDNIYQGREVLDDETFTTDSQGGVEQCPDCPYAVSNKVVLHTVNLGKGPSTKIGLGNAVVGLFDRNDPDFQAAFGNNPKASEYPIIFSSPIYGLLGSCTTDGNGECSIGVEMPGDYLTIVRSIDPDPAGDGSVERATVWVGRNISSSDFDENGMVNKNYQIIKVFRRGVFKEYRAGRAEIVYGSVLEMVTPESAIWEDTKSIYPFIFTSDSDWTVDVCARVPSGYDIVGVYDENGDLVQSTECIQTFVTGVSKAVAFEVHEIGSPEPELDATLTIVNPKGKKVKKKLIVKDIRKKTLKAKLKELRDKAKDKNKKKK